MWAAGVLALAVSLPTGPAAAAEKITVLNWQGHGTDEKWATDAFTKATGIEVVHDYFNSEQEALTKLRTSPGAYDVVLINSAFTLQAADEGLIEAARSLGATAAQTMRRIVLPLSVPGLVAGAVLIFVPVIGSFMEPRLLGGRVAGARLGEQPLAAAPDGDGVAFDLPPSDGRLRLSLDLVG